MIPTVVIQPPGWDGTPQCVYCGRTAKQTTLSSGGMFPVVSCADLDDCWQYGLRSANRRVLFNCALMACLLVFVVAVVGAGVWIFL